MRNLTQAQVNLALNQAIAKVYEAPLRPLESNMLIPRGTNGVPEGAESFSWDEITAFGMAKIVDRYSKDLPPVGFSFKKRFAGTHIIGDSFSHSFFDLQNAAFAGIPLNTKQGVLARNAALLEQDRIALEGDTKAKDTGFMNDPNVTVVGGLTGSWAGGITTGDQIVADFQAIVDAIKTASNNTETPDSAAIPANVYAYLNNHRITSDGDAPRLLQYLKDSFPGIKNWYSCDCLKGAGVNGADRVVLYTKSEDAVMNIVPMEFTMLPEQWAGLAATVNGVLVSGGTVFFRPLSAAYADINPAD